MRRTADPTSIHERLAVALDVIEQSAIDVASIPTLNRRTLQPTNRTRHRDLALSYLGHTRKLLTAARANLRIVADYDKRAKASKGKKR